MCSQQVRGWIPHDRRHAAGLFVAVLLLLRFLGGLGGWVFGSAFQVIEGVSAFGSGLFRGRYGRRRPPEWGGLQV